ncbi:uncharacterized protein LOC105829195 isoform X1 [Monomorium pharaonis]|uniref:uncharacterized protein LOC105829195 isoform X1 n=1 Tax=Monomorium pharaonis TaxID=307658 RepID=UPI001745F27B|nr:uncharacterized protein LOC105829195 isoform X1 [Monomorium pharaonis]
MLFYLTFVIFISSGSALMGFDCGGQHLNVTTISLLDVGECNLNIRKPNTTQVYIQLLQLSEYRHAEIMQCKVEISRTIYKCGMFHHISIVNNGQADYVQETGYAQCKRLLQDGTISMGAEIYLHGIRVNQTTTRSITLAGRIDSDGKCHTVQQYSDPYGTWDDVMVQGVVKITLKSSYVPVNLDAGKIMLKSGTVCPLKDGFCIDSEDGYTYWKPVPVTTCDFHQYDVLYEGTASKTQEDIDDLSSPVIYSLVAQDITFALTKTKELQLCGYTLFRTEHPKLFILETRRGDAPLRREQIAMENLDIFTYMNSKFVYVEKHLRQQMVTLYHNVMQQKCELERQVITNTLSFATLQPDEFAYRLMKGPGYMAVMSGEAIFVIKCIPVDVKIRHTKECYNELPVTLHNKTFFLTPKSRIITKYGVQKECDHKLPTLYRVDNMWVQFTPDPQERQIPPQQLQPMTKLTWKYLTPAPLADSGIYSKKDIERIREHIMFPAEKPALLNTIARGLVGHTFDSNSVSVSNLLDEASLNKIVESATSRIWKGFLTFGSATAGIFGIFLIIRIIKLIIDTAIHGYALHTVYGCSMHLLGAIWSSLTHLLLHLAHGPPKKLENQQRDTTQEQLLEATHPQELPTSIQPTPGPMYNWKGYSDNVPTAPNSKYNTYTYKNLSERLDMVEQIPPNTSEFVQK